VNPFSLDGKRIIVTGASSGLGLACARMIAGQGGQVVLMARNPQRLQSAIQTLSGAGHAALPLDVTDSEAAQTALGELAAVRKIDGLVCCAGIKITVPLRAMSSEQYANIFAINVTASLEMARIVTRKNIMSGNGASIVFLSSVMGLCGQAGLTAYAASKGALISAARAMAVELAAKKVRVNCVSPGHVLNTGMSDEISSVLSEEQQKEIAQAYPLGLGQPEDVAGAVAFLLSDAARWMTGSNVVLDGGYSAQ
jgi:NAD(P)-dependent dehydrogenase (short-subunit alcohol dehydrogenase family)